MQSTDLRFSRLILAAAAILLLRAVPLSAQQPAPASADTTKPKTTREIVVDKLRALDRSEVRDTIPKDSLATPVERANSLTANNRGGRASQQPTMEFPTDSIMIELLKLKNLAPTQYRGAEAVFIADSSSLVIFGKGTQKAGVVREGQAMTADSLLTFDETTSVACGYGKPVLSGGAAESPVESTEVCYDTRNKIGVAKGARTQVSEGANWFVNGDLYYKGGDIYGHDGKFTDCSLTIPHYHFAAKEVKVVNKNVMVARNVTLNFGDVPVFWLPFMMQSLKQGRRTGILMPDFSVNDIVRRNSNYNRRISNVGFYWAISEFLGSRVALDWWANNYTALEGSFDYNLNSKFMRGGATMKRFWRAEGGSEFTVTANHSWEPNERTNIRMDAEYATSTQFIKQTSYDPRELRRQIVSNAGMNRRFDWGSVSLQASRNHFLTDDKVDYTLPSVGVNFSTVTLFPAVGKTRFYNNATWTANAQMRRTATDFANSEFDPSGLNGNIGSSFNMGRLSWSQSFDAVQTRAQARRKSTAADSIFLLATQRMSWRTSLAFQQHLVGTTTFTPSVSLVQEMQRNDTLGGNALVRGPLRLDANASLKADVFGFWPGVGPLTRLRHRISPTIAYTYSPSASVSPGDSLRALVFGSTQGRERNTISIGISQTIEGKYKEDKDTLRADSAALDSMNLDPTKPRRLSQARKVTVLSLGTDAVVYDFVAAKTAGEHGIQTLQINNSVNSDLLRGLQLTLTHELFKPADSTAVGFTAGKRDFAPHLSRVSASFSLSNNSWLFRMFGLGKKNDAAPPTGSKETPVPADAEGGIRPTGALRPEFGVVGNRSNETAPSQRGPSGSWNASFNVTLERPRPGTIAGTSVTGLSGANQMMTTNFSFQPTQQWNVTWSTGYSFTTKDFTDHILRFTRQMHDWDANFDFIKAQNGNFSFQFNVRLRANPDIKFDYSQRSNIANRRTQ